MIKLYAAGYSSVYKKLNALRLDCASETDVIMLNIGCHLSSSDGYMAMARAAVSIGANTFQFFTRNPRGAAAKPINKADAAEFCVFAAEHNFAPIVAHAPYTMNLCSADAHIRAFTRDTMADDLARLEYTPGAYYNFHPESVGREGCRHRYIAEALDSIVKPEQSLLSCSRRWPAKAPRSAARLPNCADNRLRFARDAKKARRLSRHVPHKRRRL